MIAWLVVALCVPWQTAGASERAHAPIAHELPRGSELRAHDASAVTRHAELLRVLLENPPHAESIATLATLEERHAAAEAVAVGVVEALSERLLPPLADGQRLVHLGGGRLVLLGTPEQHTWLDEVLAEAASFHDRVRVKTRIYSGTELELPAMDSRGGLVLQKREATQLRARIESRAHDLTIAPEVLVLPWCAARLSSLEKTPYVQDYEVVEVPGLEDEILDPLLAELETGIELSVLCVPGMNGKLGLHVELSDRRLVRPLAPFALTLGKKNASATIQLYEVRDIGIDGHFDLGEEETLLLTGAHDKERVAVLIEAQRVRDEPR
jgi:hypothetical protein